jgi:hypothetical protein
MQSYDGKKDEEWEILVVTLNGLKSGSSLNSQIQGLTILEISNLLP